MVIKIILTNNSYLKPVLNTEIKDSFSLKSKVHFIHWDLLNYIDNMLIFINLIFIT